jgi:ribonuclease BN (tRNA processing enzyme)
LDCKYLNDKGNLPVAPVFLIPLGVGDAFTAHHYTSSLLLGTTGEWLLIDCPHPVRKMLREGTAKAGLPQPLDLDCISAAAVSHLHADHCCGLEDFGYYSRLALGRRAKLLMHPESSARLWDGLLAAGMGTVQVKAEAPILQKHLDDYFKLIDLSESAPVQLGPFAIECRRTIHSVPTYAFRIRVAGRVLGYSADSAFDPALIDWLGVADLVVHEVTFTRHTGVHTPYEKLTSLAEPIRSKMRLTHYPDDFDVRASVIEPLQQGRLYEV